jgi:hypothetical protein
MIMRSMAGIAVGALVASLAPDASAQVRASERGAVSQTIDGTTITIDYSRPQARGRDSLFGGVVHWGHVWTPGANWATTLEINRDITLNGHALAAGKYSVWLQVQPEEWTAIFDPQPRRFHLMAPPKSEDQLRFAVRPEEVSGHTELLSWSFVAVRPTGATLQLDWGTTAVAFDIGVAPSRPLTVAPALAERYVGSYELQHQGPLGNARVQFDISYEHDRLVAQWENAPNPLLEEVWLVHLGEGMFVPAELKDGELFDVVMDLVLEFTPLEGKATRFEMRAIGDALWGSAERTE